MVSSVEKKFKKGGLTGISLGVIALLACELPVILTLVGLGALSATASALRPPFWLEIAGIVSALVGILLLIALVIRRWRANNEAIANENR